MIFLVFLPYILNQPWSTFAFPITQLEDDAPLYQRLNEEFFDDRNLWNIIWSCLATLFACTWISVHPNIPAAHDSEWRIFFRRMAIMGYILLVPELVLYWAARQRFGASEIAQKHKEKGWCMTHAFFVIMGGLVLYDHENKFMHTLDIDELEKLHAEGKINWPSITKREINDRSKADIFSKSVVVLQTTWFIIQCISRGATKLAITELEVITLAFAAFNAIMYWLWWHKPADVLCAVPVYLKHTHCDEVLQTNEEIKSVKETDSLLREQLGVSCLTSNHILREETLQPIPLNSAEILATTVTSANEAEAKEVPLPTEKSESLLSRSVQSPGPHQTTSSLPSMSASPEPEQTSFAYQPPVKPPSLPASKETDRSPVLHHADHPRSDTSEHCMSSYISRFQALIVREYEEYGFYIAMYRILIYLPFAPFLRPIRDMISLATFREDRSRVPTFYGPNVFQGLGLDKTDPVIFGVTVLFGSIHFIAWSSTFPSVAEKWLWRLSAVMMCGSPVLIVCAAALESDDGVDVSRWRENVDLILDIFCMFLLALYMLSRLVLLVLPFTTLRSLPPSAFIELKWSMFFPHI